MSTKPTPRGDIIQSTNPPKETSKITEFNFLHSRGVKTELSTSLKIWVLVGLEVECGAKLYALKRAHSISEISTLCRTKTNY